jgi:hypothetical protein
MVILSHIKFESLLLFPHYRQLHRLLRESTVSILILAEGEKALPIQLTEKKLGWYGSSGKLGNYNLNCVGAIVPGQIDLCSVSLAMAHENAQQQARAIWRMNWWMIISPPLNDSLS